MDSAESREIGHGYGRHPLSTSYSMEMETDDGMPQHSEKIGNLLQQKSARRRTQVLLILIGVGAVLLVSTVNKVVGGDATESPGRATLDSRASFTQGEVPPSPPKHIEITCGGPNVKTLVGAQACAKICSAAQCCTESCFFDNREVCMQYHESCQILDGAASTGDENHELPKDFDGGWFEKDHFLTSVRGKKVPVKKWQPRDQLKREEACENHATRHGLKECVRLCMPAGCCYRQNIPTADFCDAPNGVEVDCRHYRDCDVLYHNTAP